MGNEEPLKDAQIRVNLDAETFEKVKEVSRLLGTTPTGFGRVLVEKFIESFETHGEHLPWPPRFQFYEHEPVTKFKPYTITPKPKRKAAEGKT